ncbi:MAG: DNA-directed RNA polymerase subunit omega [Clostridia bacterium]|nr:DNA-directed RNA polymerase subunit omega [Clostridia bacterium]
MIFPAISDLVEKIGSRYGLVIVTAKRARELSEGKEPLVAPGKNKDVTVAVNEIAAGKVVCDATCEDDTTATTEE